MEPVNVLLVMADEWLVLPAAAQVMKLVHSVMQTEWVCAITVKVPARIFIIVKRIAHFAAEAENKCVMPAEENTAFCAHIAKEPKQQ